MLWDFSKQESTPVYLKVFVMKGQFLLLLLFGGFVSNPSWTNTSMKLMPSMTHHVNLTAVKPLYTLLSEVRPRSHTWLSLQCQIARQVSECLLLTFCNYLTADR